MSESPVVYNLDGGSSGSGGCGNGGMFGNGDGSWLFAFLIIALIFGDRLGLGNNGNNGGASAMPTYIPMPMSSFGGFNASGALTRADLCSEFAFNDLNRAVEGLNSGLCNGFYTTSSQLSNGFAGVNNAICSLGYNNAQLANGINTTLMQGFNSANVVALQNQNALQTQLADCCCKNQIGQMQIGTQVERGFCDSAYAAATNTTAIIQNAHNDTDRVIARLDAMENARKDELIAELRSKLAACGDQTTAQYIINQLTSVISPRAVPAYPAASPCGLGNWAPQVLANGYYGYNNGGCGCNAGCGC